MFNSMESPDSENDKRMLISTPTGETDDESPSRVPGILGQESDDSDDEGQDYIPQELLSFVKQAEATLHSTRDTFISNASKSDARVEPAVFCFDANRSETPPMEDEEDLGLRNEVLERFKSRATGGETAFDVNAILAHYSENNANEAEEVLFSPDLKTPTSNPAYNLTGTQARKLAIGSPALMVDTDVLPIRPPTHEDSHSSNSVVDEEPIETMDPMSWLGSSLCDTPAEQMATAEKRPDPPSQPTPRQLEPTPQPDPFAFLDSVPSQTMLHPPKPETAFVPVKSVDHIGDVDETNVDPPPSSPQHAPMPAVVQIKTTAPPPLEVTVQKPDPPKMASPLPEVSVPAQSKRQEVPDKIQVERTPGRGPINQRVTTQTPAKRATPASVPRNASSKKPAATPAAERLSRPTTATATRAAIAKKMTPTPASVSKTTSSSQRSPITQTPPPGAASARVPSSNASADRSAPPVKRQIGSAQRPKVSTPPTRPTPSSDRKAPVRKTPPSSVRGTQPVSGSKVARTSRQSSPGSSTRASAAPSQSSVSRAQGANSQVKTPTQSTARVTRTFKQSQTRQSVSSSNGHAQKTYPVVTTHSSSKPSDVSSRLFQETSASKQRHATAPASVQTRASHPTRNTPGSNVPSRLLQETTATKLKHARDESSQHHESNLHTPSRSIAEPAVSSRLLLETTASRQRHAAMEEESLEHLESLTKLHARNDNEIHVPDRLLRGTEAWNHRHDAEVQKTDEPRPHEALNADVHVSDRLLQATEAWKHRHDMEVDRNEEPLHITPHVDRALPVPSRLLQPTSASLLRAAANSQPITPQKPIRSSEAELQASREKARERVRQHKVREKQKQQSPIRPKVVSTSVEEGMARARERVRLRQMKERQQQMEKEKENLGKRALSQKPKKQSYVDLYKPKPRTLTVPEAPHFSTSRKSTVRHSALSDDSSARRETTKVVNMTLAQSTDILKRGLRGDDHSLSSAASRRRGLTIARSPRFATSARHGEKLSAVGWNKTGTLASSTRLLQNQLRQEDRSLMRKRESKLTIPESPKFHQSSRRALPKSTAEREEEMMRKVNSKPFKARPYTPSGPVPIAAARKPLYRSSTTPRPFHLASGKRATTATPKELAKPKETEDDVELKKQFHARPMPSFANQPKLRKAPRANLTIDPVHPDRSISPPKLRTSDRAGRRQETAQTFSNHAEQVRRAKELEEKRRQREKHEEEMRKAQAQRNAESAAATRIAEAPFHLSSQIRHEEYKKKIEVQLRQQQEEERKKTSFQARQFRPAPAPEQKRQRQPPTTPEPFALESQQRHCEFEKKSKKKHEEAELEERQKSLFRARPIPQTTYISTSPANAQPFLLATTARRRDYEEKKKLREEAEDEEMRKQQFKARPLPATTYEYRPISPSHRSPTSSPGRQGYHTSNGNHYDRNGTVERPILVDGTQGIASPGPPVPTISFLNT